MASNRPSPRTALVAVFITAAVIIGEAGTGPWGGLAAADDLPSADMPESRASLRSSVSPFDQSNARVDLERTASIRKAIVESNRFSRSAKNIQIVTVKDGTVYLTGKTRSVDELQDVLNTAKAATPSAVIVNRLSVNAEKQ